MRWKVRVAAQRVVVQADLAIVDDDRVKGFHWTGDLRVMDLVVIRFPAAADRVTGSMPIQHVSLGLRVFAP